MTQKNETLPGQAALQNGGFKVFAGSLCGDLTSYFQCSRPSKKTQERLQKICALLGSNIRGERQAAAAAIQRVISTGAANDNTEPSRKWRWSLNPHRQAAICLQWPEALTDQEILIIAKVATAERSTASERRLLIDIASRVRHVALAERDGWEVRMNEN